MKKLLSVILLTTSLIQANPNLTEISKQAEEINGSSKLETIKEKSKLAAKKCFDAFTFTVDKADKILSKKFLIALAIIATPSFYMYSKFINPKQAKEILEATTQALAKKTTDVVTATTKGVVQGVAESAMENKSTIGLYYFLVNAIPFLIWSGSKILGPGLEVVGKNLGTLVTISKGTKVFLDAASQTY